MKPFAALRLTINRPFAGPECWEINIPADPQVNAEQFKQDTVHALEQIRGKLREQLPQ
ncbi:hypothetical protein [Paradevosia shaoguanensis]|uniref:Uncharacterized protein n=1 Tax=Paradevosia shaoguanensis TaxID=1335043 RepID=A0AA41QQG0_9HYPH|nr:hypothetical protein [Paradevosia shaoguanensis]MCF1744644.1 hypothetical protein [Paradevosia shaoguanensis]MCI0129127.1 hypothetical protein [Paradevosia shaoguanensis]